MKREDSVFFLYRLYAPLATLLATRDEPVASAVLRFRLANRAGLTFSSVSAAADRGSSRGRRDRSTKRSRRPEVAKGIATRASRRVGLGPAVLLNRELSRASVGGIGL